MASITDQTPDTDPADLGSLAGAFRAIFKKLMQNTDGMLPATVVSYNRVTNTAVVQPSIMLLSTNGSSMQRAQLASIPVLALGGGGVMINFPVQPGDTGWIEASDRDISLFLQQVQPSSAAQIIGMQKPNTLRRKSFSDGRFIPDMLRNYVFPPLADPVNDLVIATTDGTAYLGLNRSTKNITVYTENGNVTANAANGNLTAEAKSVNVSSQTTIALTATGNIIANCASFLINNIPMEKHKHNVTGVATGSATIESAGPQYP